MASELPDEIKYLGFVIEIALQSTPPVKPGGYTLGSTLGVR